VLEEFSVHPALRSSGNKVSRDLGPNKLQKLRRTANHQVPQKKNKWSYNSAPFLAWFLIKYRKLLLLRLMQLIHSEISDYVIEKIMQQRVMLLQVMITDSDMSEGDDSR
jgi:hypothetical protein